MTSLTWIFMLALVLLITPSTDCQRKKILGLFPHPVLSHFYFFHPIMRGLAERGHEVTVVSHFSDKNPPKSYQDIPLTGRETFTNSIDLKRFENRRFYNHFLEFFLLYDWGIQACNHTFNSDALNQIMRQDVKFDVILMEQFNTDCMMAVAYLLKAPVIALSSCALLPWHYERMGMPIIPSYIPAVFMGQSEEMSLMGRLGNWLTIHVMNLLYKLYTIPTDDALIENRFGYEIPSVRENETNLMFVNQHFSLSGAKPLPPSVIELGGIHIQKLKPLDEDLLNYLDNAENGVIVISWGSMIKAETMSAEKRDSIVNAMSSMKQRVLWKWENDTLQNKPDNIFTKKWLPQLDILCHPNVRVFMTHAGLMGTSEAAYCGVPVVATPMYGDQFLNAATMQQRGMGVILHYEDINENNIIRSVNKVLEKQYYDNAKKVSYSYKHRPQSALDTAMWWVEYIANTEGSHLVKSSSVHMSRFVYYSLDVYAIILGVLLVSVISWLWIINKFTSKRTRTSKIKTK